MDIKKLTDTVSVCGQIEVDDIVNISQLGFKTVVNNRPDGEVLNQPTGQQIESKAIELGLSYYFIPVSSKGLTLEDIEHYRSVYEACDKPIFAYCRTGTRSTTLWGLMQASLKDEVYSPDVIKGIAHNAGYDLSNVYNGLEYLHQAED